MKHLRLMNIDRLTKKPPVIIDLSTHGCLAFLRFNEDPRPPPEDVNHDKVNQLECPGQTRLDFTPLFLRG